jgi:hypothetical protein
MSKPKKPLRVVTAPAIGPAVSAPPILIASSHTVEFTCGHCGAALLHAEEGQVHGLIIQCVSCGSYNSTD